MNIIEMAAAFIKDISRESVFTCKLNDCFYLNHRLANWGRYNWTFFIQQSLYGKKIGSWSKGEAKNCMKKDFTEIVYDLGIINNFIYNP